MINENSHDQNYYRHQTHLEKVSLLKIFGPNNQHKVFCDDKCLYTAQHEKSHFVSQKNGDKINRDVAIHCWYDVIFVMW